MKHVLVSLMIIAGLAAILSFPNVYSDFSADKKYLLQASGYLTGKQTIYDSTLALQLNTNTWTGSNLLATLDNGVVTIADGNYLNSGTWQSTILRYGKYFIITGDSQDLSGNTIHLNLFGRITDSTEEGSVYSISGKITGAETLKVAYSAKITTISATITQPPPTTLPTTQTPTTIKVNILPGAHNINNQQYFSTSSIVVAPGSTIIWTNTDSVPHRIMSGLASATTANDQTPTFDPDGKIDSGVLAPGQSFQYTIKEFDTRTYLSPTLATRLNLNPTQTTIGITFFDPTYLWMIGVIAPISSIPTSQTGVVQVNIIPGASTMQTGQLISPSTIQVTLGTTVVIKNSDSVPHRIQSGYITTTTEGSAGVKTTNAPQFATDGLIDTGVLAPSQTFQFTVSKKLGTLAIFDPSYTWINGVITSVSEISNAKPVQISIDLGSSKPKGSAVQQQFNQYNSYYTPTTIQLTPGTKVIWTNNDSIAHTILSGTSTQNNVNPFVPDGKINSGVIAPGKSFQVIINGSGIIRFYDPTYNWMNGIIVSVPPSTSKIIAAPSHNPGLH